MSSELTEPTAASNPTLDPNSRETPHSPSLQTTLRRSLLWTLSVSLIGFILTAMIVSSANTDTTTLSGREVIGWPGVAAIIAWTVAALAASITVWGSRQRVKDKLLFPGLGILSGLTIMIPWGPVIAALFFVGFILEPTIYGPIADGNGSSAFAAAAALVFTGAALITVSEHLAPRPWRRGAVPTLLGVTAAIFAILSKADGLFTLTQSAAPSAPAAAIGAGLVQWPLFRSSRPNTSRWSLVARYTGSILLLWLGMTLILTAIMPLTHHAVT